MARPGLDENSRRGWRGFGQRRRSRLDTPRRIVLRDFLIFEIKLLLDGFKGAVISVLAIPALALDLVLPGERPGHRFYGVMRLGDRLDRWLSLYGIADAAEADPEGMFGVSRAGSPTLLGKLETFMDRAVVGDEVDRRNEAGGGGAPDQNVSDASRVQEGTDGQAAPGGRDGKQERVARAAGKAAELFDRGLSVLDRAVEVLERPGPAGRDAQESPETGESPPQPGEPPSPTGSEDRRAAGGAS